MVCGKFLQGSTGKARRHMYLRVGLCIFPAFRPLFCPWVQAPALPPGSTYSSPHPTVRPLSPTPYAFSQTKAPTPAQSSPLSSDLLPHLGSQTSTSLLRDSHPESGRSYGEGLLKPKNISQRLPKPALPPALTATPSLLSLYMLLKLNGRKGWACGEGRGARVGAVCQVSREEGPLEERVPLPSEQTSSGIHPQRQGASPALLCYLKC